MYLFRSKSFLFVLYLIQVPASSQTMLTNRDERGGLALAWQEWVLLHQVCGWLVVAKRQPYWDNVLLSLVNKEYLAGMSIEIPRLTLETAHPICFRSARSQDGSFVGAWRLGFDRCVSYTSHNLRRLCELNKANMVVYKNRSYEMKFWRQVFLLGLLRLTVFCFFRVLGFGLLSWSSQ